MQLAFKREGNKMLCRVRHGKQSVTGSADISAIAAHVKRHMKRHGRHKTAHAMGCTSGDDMTLAGEVLNEAKIQALEQVATVMGWSPFRVLKKAAKGIGKGALKVAKGTAHLTKKAAWDYNPVVQLNKRLLKYGGRALKATGRAAISPFRSKGGGGGGGGGPEGPDEPDEGGEEQDPAEKDNDAQQPQPAATEGDDMSRALMQQYEISACSGGVDSLVGDYEIGGDDLLGGLGFLPAALAAYQHRRQLSKIAKSGNPRAASAAKTLAKAKSGDKASKKKIAIINARAKAGDPKAKDAMKRLHTVDAMAKKGVRSPIAQLFHDGIT